MCQEEGGSDVFRRCASRQVDRFGDAAVAVTLKDGLSPNMMLGGDIVCGHKQH